MIELGYHDSAGNDGTLLLVETRPDINFLSTLLDENLLVTTPRNPIINPALYIITPKGLQIGKDASVKAITYLPLSLPYVTSDVLMADSTTNIKINNINERAPINTIIDKKQLVDSIVAAVNRGETIAFDLCAGLTDPKCEQALMDAVEKDNLIELSLRSLTIHHLIYPDESLSNVITQHFSNITAFFKSKIADYDDYQASSLLYEMAIALSAKKIGNWTNPLIELARLEQTGYYREVCSVLLVVNSSLSKTQSEQLEKICVPKT